MEFHRTELQAYCPYCKKTVSAYTRLRGDELKRALESDGDIEVMHTPGPGDTGGA